MTEDQRCAEAKEFQRMDGAFRAGDLDALRAAVGDPALIPNGPMPAIVGSCLVYAIYHSPFSFIRTLLEIGADPNAPANDGFPPLIAALSCARDVPGAKRRSDVCEILKLLLEFGANPNQRGLNDYTSLHMAVESRDARAVQILIEGGADPEIRTRIDDCQTPLEMAAGAGLEAIAELLRRHRQPIRQRLRSGLFMLTDIPGTGDPVRRQQRYRVRLRLWLSQGEAVRWRTVPGADAGTLLDHGETLVTEIRIHRGSLINGLFYGVEGMRVGGTRRLEIASDLAYGGQGVPEVIPPGASLTAEITILEKIGD
jgi:ankyrin repeat protein